MEYKNIQTGIFLSRPNRFVAYVETAGQVEKVHVKNTGRCRELLVEGAEVFLERADNLARKTGYDLVTVKKNGRLINMDSVAPNRAAREWLEKGGLFPDIKCIRPETRYGSSRFDFYVETEKEKIFLEVKGVTLEEGGTGMFPDAPSLRAVKHVEELIQAKKEGYEAYILFVIQMKDILNFTPNRRTQPTFCRILREAHRSGVHILAYDCNVWEKGMEIDAPVEVIL